MRAVPLTRSRLGLAPIAMKRSPTFGFTWMLPRVLEHAVSVVVREREAVGAQDLHEARWAALERAVGPTLGIGRGDKEEGLALDEVPVLVLEPVAPQTLDEAIRQCAAAEGVLELPISGVKHAHRCLQALIDFKVRLFNC